MKTKIRLWLAAAAVAVGAGVTSCSDDDFTASIFDTNAAIDILDRTSYTFPLDTFCKKEFLEPYNLKFIYRFEDKGSDMNKNLTPPDYDKSVDLAVLTKYLWYDIYKEIVGEEFLKLYSPRVIHVCGSKNYNPSQGTETLGDASSGIKINLYNVNNLNPEDVDNMNHYFFKTMHHEFSHILDQTYLHPTAFNVISNNAYDASGWSDSPDSLKAGLGFTSSYASSAKDEDWAETMANYITVDTLKWVQLLQTATYEWEEIDCDDLAAYNKLIKPGCNKDTIGYFKESDNGVTIPIYDQGTRYETAADVEHIYDIVMSTKKQLGYDESIYNVIMEEASAYFSGEKSVEEVTKLINNRVGIILTENR